MFEDYSTLEEFRVAYHGKSKLRFLSRKPDSKKYVLIKLIEKAFFIGRKDDAEESKHQEFLTIELTRSGLLKSEYLQAIAVDLVEENGSFKRYSFGAERQGSFQGSWIVTVLNANFNDKQEVVEV